MPIDENPPLSKRTGLAVTLAIVALAWYAISSGWLNFELSSSDVESRKAKANLTIQKVGTPAATELQPNIAFESSTPNYNQ